MESFNWEAPYVSSFYNLLPDAVENIPIRVDPDVEVGGEDVVEGSNLLVPEERVRHPHLTSVSQSQVFDPLWNERFFIDVQF